MELPWPFKQLSVHLPGPGVVAGFWLRSGLLPGSDTIRNTLSSMEEARILLRPSLHRGLLSFNPCQPSRPHPAHLPARGDGGTKIVFPSTGGCSRSEGIELLLIELPWPFKRGCLALGWLDLLLPPPIFSHRVCS